MRIQKLIVLVSIALSTPSLMGMFLPTAGARSFVKRPVTIPPASKMPSAPKPMLPAALMPKAQQKLYPKMLMPQQSAAYFSTQRPEDNEYRDRQSQSFGKYENIDEKAQQEVPRSGHQLSDESLKMIMEKELAQKMIVQLNKLVQEGKITLDDMMQAREEYLHRFLTLPLSIEAPEDRYAWFMKRDPMTGQYLQELLAGAKGKYTFVLSNKPRKLKGSFLQMLLINLDMHDDHSPNTTALINKVIEATDKRVLNYGGANEETEDVIESFSNAFPALGSMEESASDWLFSWVLPSPFEKIITKLTLLTAESLINAKSSESITPIAIAAYANRADLVKKLVEHGADPNIRSRFNYTPIKQVIYMYNVRKENDSIDAQKNREQLKSALIILQEAGAFITPRDLHDLRDKKLEAEIIEVLPYSVTRLPLVVRMQRWLRWLRGNK